LPSSATAPKPPVHAGTLRSEFGETPRRFSSRSYVTRVPHSERRFKNESLAPVFAVLQSTVAMSRRACRPTKAQRPRARPRPAWRRDVAILGTLSGDHVSPQSAVRLVRYVLRFLPIRHLLDAGRTARISRSEECGQPNTSVLLETRPIRRWKSSTSPSAKSRMRPARRWYRTMCSRRAVSSRRSRSARTAWLFGDQAYRRSGPLLAA